MVPDVTWVIIAVVNVIIMLICISLCWPITMICLQVIMATNRIDILDSALLRPGRIDRKIEFPAPNEEVSNDLYVLH